MNDDQFRDLIEHAYQIQEMQQHLGWHTWDTHLRKRIDAKKREMLAGKETLEAYRYTAGWIEGCQYALDATGELERQKTREANRRGVKTKT